MSTTLLLGVLPQGTAEEVAEDTAQAVREDRPRRPERQPRPTLAAEEVAEAQAPLVEPEVTDDREAEQVNAFAA